MARVSRSSLLSKSTCIVPIEVNFHSHLQLCSIDLPVNTKASYRSKKFNVNTELEANSASHECTSFASDGDDCNHISDEEGTDQQWESARLLLKATECYSLPHHGVDDFCETVQMFVDDICTRISGRSSLQIQS